MGVRRTRLLFLAAVAGVASGAAASVTPLWPNGGMPDPQPHQVAVRLEVAEKSGFDAAAHRLPYLQWCEAPVSNRTGSCMLIISGGGYQNLCDGVWVDRFADYLTARGVQCVSLWYRTPRPKGLPIYQSGWEDGQRAVRLVRSAAKERGFDPEKIGALGFSAGAHLTLLLATSSQTPAYSRVDAIDDIPCHVNLAVPIFPAYVLSDGLEGANKTKGDAPDVTLNPCFKFDAKTCPMCLVHGSDDIYSSIGSILVYRKLHAMGVSSDLHVYADRGHGFVSDNALLRVLDRWVDRVGDFLKEKGFLDRSPSRAPALTPEHIALEVADPEAMEKWWCENLGFRVTLRRPSGSRFLADATGALAFEVYGPKPGATPVDHWKTDDLKLHFGFSSADAEKDMRRLVAAGATCGSRDDVPGLKGYLMRDPQGIPFQIVQRANSVLR